MTDEVRVRPSARQKTAKCPTKCGFSKTHTFTQRKPEPHVRERIRKWIRILEDKLRTLLSFGHFWTNFGYVSHILVIRFWCHFARRSTFGCRMTAKFHKNCMDSFWQIWNFHWKVGRKRYDCVSSRNFFPTPKKICYVVEDCRKKKKQFNLWDT